MQEDNFDFGASLSYLASLRADRAIEWDLVSKKSKGKIVDIWFENVALIFCSVLCSTVMLVNLWISISALSGFLS